DAGTAHADFSSDLAIRLARFAEHGHDPLTVIKGIGLSKESARDGLNASQRIQHLHRGWLRLAEVRDRNLDRREPVFAGDTFPPSPDTALSVVAAVDDIGV